MPNATPISPPSRTFVLDARTATSHFPGIGRYVRNLAPALAAQLEPEEQLVILRPSGAEGIDLPATAGIRYVDVQASPFALNQQWQIPRLVRHLAASPAATAPDATRSTHHFPLVYHSPYYLMPYGVRMPTVLTFYDIIPLHYPEYVSRRARAFFRLTLGMALRAATRVVAISEAARRDLLAAFALAPEKVITTPLAADPHFQPQPAEAIDRVRAHFALPPSFLLYVGINKPHKNLVAMIEAFAQVREEVPDAMLILAGPWDDRYPEAQEAAARLALGDAVRFLGTVAEEMLPALYGAATGFVFPSRYEGFGLPVLEAMACGTPVACSNVSSLPEVAGDGALTFDPGQPAEITQAMRRLLQDAPLRESLRARGLAQAGRFNWQRTAAATLAVYRQVGAIRPGKV
jgi:alpha-1,3-rhamnosyl/mannosyltransferase